MFTPEGPGYDFVWSGASAYLALHDIVVNDGIMAGDDIAPTNLLDMRERLTFLPRGVRVSGWGEPARQGNSFVALYFDQDWLLDQLEVPPKDRDLQPVIYFRDRALTQCLCRLGEFARARTHVSKAMSDSLMIVAGLELMCALARTTSEGANLTARQLDAVREFVRANIANDVCVAEMAAIAGQSVFHFTRQFKKATGKSPYKFVLEERTERAKLLLRDTTLPISAVAQLTGFNTASQFSRTFSEIVGLNPRAYRRALH
ncbi:MAG: hypothetical protein A4S17_00820 [Proteobacteria bacterium HN_bin10]|nr:MAG: hypothetical protein A4S17_00820 [Proteobacteria bacterium HN_bin10]